MVLVRKPGGRRRERWAQRASDMHGVQRGAAARSRLGDTPRATPHLAGHGPRLASRPTTAGDWVTGTVSLTLYASFSLAQPRGARNTTSRSGQRLLPTTYLRLRAKSSLRRRVHGVAPRGAPAARRAKWRTGPA